MWGGKLRHGGQERPLAGRPEVTGCLESCWLIPVPPPSHVQMPPRAREERRGHVQPSAPLGPRGPCGVTGLCLSTLKFFLNRPWMSGDPRKNPFGGCTEHTVGPQIHGMMRGDTEHPSLAASVSFPVPAPSPAPAPAPCSVRTQGCTSAPPNPPSKVSEGSGNIAAPTVSPTRSQVLKSRLTGCWSGRSHPYGQTAGHGWGDAGEEEGKTGGGVKAFSGCQKMPQNPRGCSQTSLSLRHPNPNLRGTPSPFLAAPPPPAAPA